MKRDYYEVLGVDRRATSDEIRQAYRRLARQHHPDVRGNEPGAEARFKEINEAYEVLRDPERRALYDRYGHAGLDSRTAADAGYPFSDLGDIFDQLFGFGSRPRPRSRPAVERGQDRRVRLRLDLPEAGFGVTRTIEVDRFERCEACGGTGAEPGSGSVICSTCQGQGEIRRAQEVLFGRFVTSQTCPQCRGEGQVIGTPCATCRGDGRILKRRRLEVDIPPGIEDGMQIRLTGEGDAGLRGGPHGDLFVVVEVAPHPLFERQGGDLHLVVRINPAEAALGSAIEVPTLDGATTLVVPAGTQTGDTVVVEGKGVHRLGSERRGNLVVTVQVITPTKLSREERRLFEQLRLSLPSAQVVDRRSVWERVRERLG